MRLLFIVLIENSLQTFRFFENDLNLSQHVPDFPEHKYHRICLRGIVVGYGEERSYFKDKKNLYGFFANLALEQDFVLSSGGRRMLERLEEKEELQKR